MTDNTPAIPVYLLKIRPHADEPHIVERLAGWYDAEMDEAVTAPIDAAEWDAILSQHKDHIIYSEIGFYYAFDMIEVVRDAEARYEAAMVETSTEADYYLTLDSFLADAR